MLDHPSDSWVNNRLKRWSDEKESEALGELLKWQRDRAYAVALGILGRGVEAEDAVQQACLKVFRSGQVFADQAHFKATLCRVVTQCSIDVLRSRKNSVPPEHAMARKDQMDRAREPAAVAENAEALQLLTQECASLRPEDRALLTLCCQEGLSLSAASESLGLSRETARDRLTRLLRNLRARLSRRGVSLSLLLLIGLFRQGRTAMAGESLCGALDAALPGAGCATILPAKAAGLSAVAILAQIGLASGKMALILGLSTACVLAVAGGTFLLNGSSIPTAAPSTPLVQPPPGTEPVEAVPVPQAATEPIVVDVGPPADPKPPENPSSQLTGVPLDVVEAAQSRLPGIQLQTAKREKHDGRNVFELRGTLNDELFEIEVSTEGEVLEVDRVEKTDQDDEEDEEEHEEKAEEEADDAGDVIAPPAAPKVPVKDAF